jgi:hypothetical protein
MIRVALFSIVIAACTAAMLTGWPINFATTPSNTVTSRFPEEWESAPVVDYKKRPPLPSGISRMSIDEFTTAMTAVERLRRPPPRPPQPPDAVFNDTQIASMKDRLELTKEQEPY